MTSIHLHQDCTITQIKGWYGVKIIYQSAMVDGVRRNLPFQRCLTLEPIRRLTWSERVKALLFGTVCQRSAINDVPEIHPDFELMEKMK